MELQEVYLWQKAPALKLLLPFITGILLQWYLQLSLSQFLPVAGFLVPALLLHRLISFSKKFRFRTVQGLALNGVLVTAGMLAIHANNIGNQTNWFARDFKKGDILELRVEEPLVEKPNSFKTVASVQSIIRKKQKISCSGRLIVYFRKDSFAQTLTYGRHLLTSKPVQVIKNSGNPGAFDYKQYNLFQGITHQVYLDERDFHYGRNNPGVFRQWIFKSRSFLIATLEQHMPGEKERGLAEALLIGYKNDLDKSLLQSYANTGVVHVIAISGLHLGLIYGILLLLTKPLKRKGFRLIRVCIIISGLWIFSLLAGAQPSVLRSAVMFSAIALAVVLQRKTSIYNTMALSAFLLLCYQPFWLWDLGFLLSYTAVLSILIFFRPVYNWFYFQNKAVDAVWKLAAVTIAAQVLTTPLSLFHFHQFPLLFLVTNLLAVPLSSIILIGTILLCTLFFIPVAAKHLGVLLESMIRFLNRFIEQMDQTGLIWEGISISLLQTLLLYGIILALSLWLLGKMKLGIWIAAGTWLLFFVIRANSFLSAKHQHKMIVYQVPKQKAVDLMDGRRCLYLGNSLPADLQNFHIKQSRIASRIQRTEHAALSGFQFCGKKILILDKEPAIAQADCSIDILILSGKPFLQMEKLQKKFMIRQVVIDSSVPVGKARLWQQQCRALNIPCHNVAEEGAFVINFHTPTFAAS